MSTNNNNNTLSLLDRIRINHGNQKLREAFGKLAGTYRERAVKLLNDNRILFYTLYVLLPDIDAYNLYSLLNSRNKMALKMSTKALKDENIRTNLNSLPKYDNRSLYSTLKWMFQTGYEEDGSDDEFDEVLDKIFAILVRKYEDKTTLPILANMIFKRNRQDRYIHDLVWAFFEIKDPFILELVADFLRSPDDKDVELACRLLNIESIAMAKNMDKYEAYLAWFKENRFFLHFTGENYQLTSTPTFYRVDLDAKYLSKRSVYRNRKRIISYSESEKSHLKDFNELEYEERVVLAEISHKIHNQNPRVWSDWIKSPVKEQKFIAKLGLGGDFL